MTVVVGELARRLTDSLILPFNSETYSFEIQKEFNKFEKENIFELNCLNITLDQFRASVTNFTYETKKFHAKLNKIDKTKYT